MERKKWYACQFLWYTALEEVKRKSKLFSLRRFLILHLRKKFGFYISLDKNGNPNFWIFIIIQTIIKSKLFKKVFNS